MSKTFDLSTLNLSAGTHEITVKARANGYADSPASNAVSYVVAVDTVQVSGTWYFNETLQMPTNRINQAVNFKGYLDNGYSLENSDCKGMSVGRLTSNSQATEFYKAVDFNGTTSDGVTRSQLVYSEKNGWKNEAYRTITFDGVQTVSKEFYDWLVANAQPYTVSGTWRFNDIPNIAGQYINEPCKFTTESGYSVNGIEISDSKTTIYRVAFNAGGKSGYDINNGWDSGCQVITFDGTQYVSQEFYDWFVANAVRQTISFTIENAHDYDTTTYYADVGMTWAEWCDSEYNTRGGYIFNNTVMVWCYPTTEEYNSGLKDVVPTDVISNGGAYVATTDGPCVT